MITYESKIEIHNLNQISYQEELESLNINAIKCSCGHCDCAIHGYYKRFYKFKEFLIKLRILRVKCKACKCTHAIIPLSLIPYSRIPLETQINIIKTSNADTILNDEPLLDYCDFYRVKNNYLNYFKERILAMSLDLDEDIVRNFSYWFSQPFLTVTRLRKCNYKYFDATT